MRVVLQSDVDRFVAVVGGKPKADWSDLQESSTSAAAIADIVAAAPEFQHQGQGCNATVKVRHHPLSQGRKS